MTESIFDPTGPNAQRGGTRFTPAEGIQVSHLPERFTNPPSTEPDANVGFLPPVEKPSVEVSSEDEGKVLFIQLSGTLHSADYRHFVPLIEKAVQKHGKARLLVQMHDFHGWDAGALWQDVKFDVRHFNDIERLAIVGESTQEKWMVSFCTPFTTAKIQYFSPDQLAEARIWVAAVS